MGRRGHELPQSRINRVQCLVQGKDDVLRSSADRVEMCHHKVSNKCTHTQMHTCTYTGGLSSHTFFMVSLRPATPSPWCLLASLPALLLFIPSLPLFLWVTLTRAWGGGEEEEEEEEDTTRRDRWVCPPHQTAASALSASSAAGQDFCEGLFQLFCLSPWKYDVTRALEPIGRRSFSFTCRSPPNVCYLEPESVQSGSCLMGGWDMY